MHQGIFLGDEKAINRVYPEAVRASLAKICALTETLYTKTAVLDAPDYRTGEPVILERDTLRVAVNTAYDMARPGDVVLLSPASASFDQFKNFEERGNAFKQFVGQL